MSRSDYILNLPLSTYDAATLDRAYDQAMTMKNYAYADKLAAEIRDRIGGLRGFVLGVMGIENYPNYKKWLGFSQVEAAQSSVSAQIQKVANTAGASVRVAGVVALAVLAVVLFIKIK